MSRTANKNTFLSLTVISIIILLTGCRKNIETSNIYNKNTANFHGSQFITPAKNIDELKQILNTTDDYDVNKYHTDQKEINENIGSQINKVQYDPVNVVDSILQGSSNKLNIAVIAPTTGKYASIGNTITESILLTASKSKYNNTGTIKIYNIGQLPATNWLQDEEVQRLLKDNNDVIIGSFFADTTQKLLSVIPEDKLFISFMNNTELAKHYPNLVVLSMDEGYKINSLFQYLNGSRRKFLSLIFPATNKGYTNEKLFRKLAQYHDIKIINSQFYQSKSRSSILAAIRNLKKSFSATFITDQNGNLTTETYKDNKARKNQNQNYNEQKIETKTVDTNSIYIDAEYEDLLTILNGISNQGILDRDVQIFSNALVQQDYSNATKLESIFYIGYNYNFADSFNKTFTKYYKRTPNYIAYMAYDTIAMLYYIFNEGKMLPRKLYNEDGFRGVLDEFRFTRDGNVERRFGIYQLKNNAMSRVFIPNDYLPLDITKGGQQVYFK